MSEKFVAKVRFGCKPNLPGLGSETELKRFLMSEKFVAKVRFG